MHGMRFHFHHIRQPQVGHAAFDGLAALLGMMTSCAAGVSVVNIDNGFGAAVAVARMITAGRTVALTGRGES